MQRKGQNFKVIATIVIFVVVLMAILSITNKIFAGTKAAIRSTECKASVTAEAKSKLFGVPRVASQLTEEFLGVEVKCPTQDILIKERVNEKNDATIKKKIAMATYRCADDFLLSKAAEGEFDLFEGEGIFCAVCSIIKFKDKDKEVTGLSGYMAKNFIPNFKYEGRKVTYLGFLDQSYQTEKAADVIDDLNENQKKTLEQDNLKTDRAYSVLYIYAKGDDWVEKALHALDSTAGSVTIGGGAVAGAGVALVFVLGASNPVGWAVLGVGALVAGVSWFFTEEKAPEHAAFVVLRQHHEEEFKQLGCTYLPVVQGRLPE